MHTRVRKNNLGATMVETALLVAVISALVLVAIRTTLTKLSCKLDQASSNVNGSSEPDCDN
jgi:Flp pilus assembly pilin Flp